ncbi:oligosaccharide flippase family protein [Arthrobacter sulfonylureivorans]|uniref:Oligosaccharide flippase family protein n=1 Tax=Arthrobacter sulfonylureivorans TaxID=2486855 RepID=A0ABY3WC02_9MICC|nr:oligosaccharide flippase family protein [Arthrobacter sulfonylureivorans]UNK45812.1 oligosaccharide flippase family protein [Arthrobacter sulfonylureivorans]
MNKLGELLRLGRRSSLGQGVLLSTVGNVMTPAVGLVTAPLLAQALGAGGRGELAAATAPLILATTAAACGLPEAVTYYVARGGQNVRRLLSRACLTLLGIGLAATLFVVLSSGPLSNSQPRLQGLMVLAILALIPALLLGAVRAAAAGYHAWALVGLERLTGAVLRLGAIVALALTNSLTLEAATATIAITHFAGIGIYLILPAVIRRRSPAPTARAADGLFRYGMVIWPGAVLGILLARVDQMLMMPLAGAVELGIYAVAVTISELALIFNAAVRDVMFAAESSRPDQARMLSAARISTMITGVISLVIALAAAWAVPEFFGPDFAPAVPVIWLLLLGTVLGNPGSVAGAGLNARGRPGLRSWSIALALGASLAALILLAPPLGAIGAASATLIGNIVSGGLNIIWMRKYFAVPAGGFVGIRSVDLRVIAGMLSRGKNRSAAPALTGPHGMP